MDDRDNLLSAASGSLEYLFNPGQHDYVLILTDTHCLKIAEAFKLAAAGKGCPVIIYEIKNNERPVKEIPTALEKLLPKKTIVLNIIKAYPEETPFRIKWIFKVEENKRVKMGHLPGITVVIMLRSV
ncbi:MAG: hypothetical protein H6Q27_748, partial [Ignavibacteriaceae bacterium]|nr:hypothetical protein [Ignavibacteriaceae bacterium]